MPDDIRLVFLPPYTPELQPDEMLWVHVDEPIVNRHFEMLVELDAAQCVTLRGNRTRVKG